MMLSAIKNRFFSLIQLILVFIYIIFEEIIWEGIAKPIYRHIHSLKILQKIEKKLYFANPIAILFIFITLLIVVEFSSIYAGILFVKGHILLGLGLYLSKIPVAAFTFWLFKVTEDKLMKFRWFRWLYKKIMKIIAWLKSSSVYKDTMKRLRGLKKEIKRWKIKHFSKSNPFLFKIKHLYKMIKTSLK